MVFYSPSWVPHLPQIPDSISLEQFIHDETYGRRLLKSSRNPFVCGVTGKTYSATEAVKRVDYLSRALYKRLGVEFSSGTERNRVVAIYSLNTVDYILVSHSVHRLSGIVTPVSAAYSASELQYQLHDSGARAIFTCTSLLQNARVAATGLGIPEENIFLLSLPQTENDPSFVTVNQLVQEGSSLSSVSTPKWSKGQSKRQIAFLSYSSGTSGPPKAVMISHYNAISHILQISFFDAPARKDMGVETQVSLGVLPFSHILGLSVIAHVNQYRGDSVVVLPQFDMSVFLDALRRFKVEHLSLVPPILIQLISNPDFHARSDFSSVRSVSSGAAALGRETMDDVLKVFPKWIITQSYGMTETCATVLKTSELDIYPGSSGSLIPGCIGKLIDIDGKEVTGYGQRGELLIQGPSVALGYLNNEEANAETYIDSDDGRWIKSGDEVLVRKSKEGYEHFFIVDRIKNLIKVNGYQVSPAELEAHLLNHEFVSDCAIIPVPDDLSGEAPKAFIVRSRNASGRSHKDISSSISQHVEEHKAVYKWLRGGIEYIDDIPKSPSGKILHRILRDKERQKNAKKEMASTRQERPSPAPEVLATLQNLWALLLGSGTGSKIIQADDNFLLMGGNSVIAMRLVGAARKQGLNLTVADIFRNPRLQDLALVVTGVEDGQDNSSNVAPFSLLPSECSRTFIIQSAAKELDDVPEEYIHDVFPVTDLQAGMLKEPRGMATCFLADFSSMQISELSKMCQRLCDCVDSFRSAFIWINGQAFQVVLNITPPVEIIRTSEDISTCSDRVCEHFLATIELWGGLLTRFAIIHNPTTSRTRLVMRLSHTQFDGVSMGYVKKYFEPGYSELQAETELSFAVYVKHCLHPRAEALQYWQDLLKHAKITTFLRDCSESDCSKPACGRVDSVTEVVPIPVTPPGITPATVFATACACAISRVAQSQDVLFYYLTTGRNTLPPHLHDIIGPCLNTLPIRYRAQDDRSFSASCAYMQEQVTCSRSFEDLNLQAITEYYDGVPGYGCIIQFQDVTNAVQTSADKSDLVFQHYQQREVYPLPKDIIHIMAIPEQDTWRILVTGHYEYQNATAALMKDILDCLAAIGRERTISVVSSCP